MTVNICYGFPLSSFLCPVSTVANIENNEIRIEKNKMSGHILLALLSIPLTFVSRYSAFSIRGTGANTLKNSNDSCLSRERGRIQNNVTRS